MNCTYIAIDTYRFVSLYVISYILYWTLLSELPQKKDVNQHASDILVGILVTAGIYYLGNYKSKNINYKILIVSYILSFLVTCHVSKISFFDFDLRNLTIQQICFLISIILSIVITCHPIIRNNIACMNPLFVVLMMYISMMIYLILEKKMINLQIYQVIILISLLSNANNKTPILSNIVSGICLGTIFQRLSENKMTN